MRILLTGATGCLGRTLASRLIEQGHDVTALVRPASMSELAPGRGSGPVPSLTVTPLDLFDPFESGRLPDNCDIVVHAAQARRYREFPAAAGHIFRINTAATQELASYALDAGARQFIYLSTGSVCAPQVGTVDENAPVAPDSFYAASKLAAETLLGPYADHLTVLILRPFYMYGPGQRGMLVSHLAEAITCGNTVKLVGRDGMMLTPTFSDDVASVCAQAITEGWSGTFNVANPVAVSLRRLAETIGRTVGKAPAFDTIAEAPPMPLLPDVRKLGRSFDLTLMVDLEEGMRRTLAAQSTKTRVAASRGP